MVNLKGLATPGVVGIAAAIGDAVFHPNSYYVRD
jgi:hypothetical protein